MQSTVYFSRDLDGKHIKDLYKLFRLMVQWGDVSVCY